MKKFIYFILAILLIYLLIKFWPIFISVIIIYLLYYFLIAKNNKNNDSNNSDTTIILEQEELNQNNNFNTQTEYFDTRAEINAIYSQKFDELLIGEIILLDWLQGKPQDKVPPQYFAYVYGINYNTSISKLMKNGYLKIASASESLSSLKVEQLKDILRKANLQVSGKKAQLIERIANNIPETEYYALIPTLLWSITKSGYEILEKYDLFVWAHKNGSYDRLVTPATVAPYLNKGDSNEAIALMLSEQHFKENFYKINYDLAHTNLQYQIHIKNLENKIDEALTLEIVCFILELTGISSKNYDGNICIRQDSVNIDYIKSNIIEYQALLGITNDELIDLAKDIYDLYEPKLSKVKLYNSKKEFIFGFKTMLFNTKKDMDKLIENWYERLPIQHKIID